MAYYPFNYLQESALSYPYRYGSIESPPDPGNLGIKRNFYEYFQYPPRVQDNLPMRSFPASNPNFSGEMTLANNISLPIHSPRTTRREKINARSSRDVDVGAGLVHDGYRSLQTAGTQSAVNDESLRARLALVPSHKRSLINVFDMDPHIRSTAVDLLVSCTRAEQELRTWEPGAEMTDRLLQPISRPTASTGLGSRRGLEAYQCLWSACGRRISKRTNAISHLLSHVQYKPFLCNQCPHYPRFRYKHDYTRHCRGHTFSVPQVDSHRHSYGNDVPYH